jgi:hypothetical protein
VVAVALVRELNTALEAVLLLLWVAQAAVVRLMVQVHLQVDTLLVQAAMVTQHKAALVVVVASVLI